MPLDRITPVGRLRRYSPDVGRVSLLAVVAHERHHQTLDTFSSLPSVTGVAAREADEITVVTAHGPVTLHLAEPANAGSAAVWLTGSRAHIRGLQTLAGERGLRFDEGQLTDAAGRLVASPTEEDFYARLGLPYVAPELRHGDDEIRAAAAGTLPALLTTRHMRGDLHMHSTWSDGRDSIEDMVRASAALGYEYMAITDHSQRAWSNRTLSEDDVARQREEIARIRSEHPAIRVLHGVEVDILLDGTLDFDDAILAGFDIVLASLHDHGSHPGPRLTERYLAAMQSPYVDVITHPTNRSPGVSDGYDLDFDRLCDAAVQTGTALEVDGAPGHLDLDGALARRAAQAGVTIVVDSDCHRAAWLGRQMRFGVGTARRGWLEPRHVLNTRPVEDVLAFVARKRARA